MSGGGTSGIYASVAVAGSSGICKGFSIDGGAYVDHAFWGVCRAGDRNCHGICCGIFDAAVSRALSGILSDPGDHTDDPDAGNRTTSGAVAGI